jgi:hypothetical protein
VRIDRKGVGWRGRRGAWNWPGGVGVRRGVCLRGRLGASDLGVVVGEFALVEVGEVGSRVEEWLEGAGVVVDEGNLPLGGAAVLALAVLVFLRALVVVEVERSCKLTREVPRREQERNRTIRPWC